MMIVVFRNRLHPSEKDAFAEQSDAVYALASQMPGFISSKDFVAEDGERVAIIEFRSAEELRAWREQADHAAAQAEGRRRYFEQYSLQVCELVRESRFVKQPDSEARAQPAAVRPVPQIFEGGCLCGKIRYRISGTPTQPTICHCSICRRASGAPFVAWATFETDQIEWLSGAPRRFDSSPKAARTFCGDCGTALTFRLHAIPDLTDVTVASLDAPERIQPTHHIFTTTRLPWVRLADGLPSFPGERDPDGD